MSSLKNMEMRIVYSTIIVSNSNIYQELTMYQAVF